MFAVQSKRFKAMRAWWAVLLSLALTIPMAALVAAVPAIADEGDPEYLQIDKSISANDLTAGDQFTYQIQVTCSQTACINATIDDLFPAELDGFPITNVNMTSSVAGTPYSVEWSNGTADAPATFGPDTSLHVAVEAPLPAGAIGMTAGTTFSISISSQVPADQPPGVVDFTNEADTTADNAQPVSDAVPATITVPRNMSVDVTKAWSPSDSTWAPGNESTITVSATNTSNGAVEQLIVQEPQAADDGAASLDASNPFVLNDFAGFGSTTIPGACTTAQVDAYVFANGAWSWVEGAPADTLALPTGVTNDAVGGVRITCADDVILATSSVSYDFDLTQREVDRNTGASFETETRTTENIASGTATVEGMDPVTDQASATHTITPTNISAAATKDISPSRIPAGDTAAASISTTNTSSGPVSELRISDLDYLTADLTFDGFTAAPVWPEGAESAAFVYYPLDGSAPVTVSFANGETPAVPANIDISGFELVYAASSDAIAVNTSSSAAFTIATDPDMAAAAEVATINAITGSVTTASGRTATAPASDDLTVVDPSINVGLTKSVLPGSAVEPGQSVTTSLTAGDLRRVRVRRSEDDRGRGLVGR